MSKWDIIKDETIMACAPQQSGRFTKDGIVYWQIAVSAGKGKKGRGGTRFVTVIKPSQPSADKEARMSYKHLEAIPPRFSLYQVITDNGVAWQIVGVRASEEGIWYELVCPSGRWSASQAELVEKTAQQELPF